jgi:hypothetical protein
MIFNQYLGKLAESRLLMAFDNKGGFGLSEQKAITNPYFGK